MSFVPVGPAKLRPETGSEAPILTEGRPRSVMRRSSTVSWVSSPLGEVSGCEDVNARSDATLSVDNFEGATPKNGRLTLCERGMQLLRGRQKQEQKVHCRECN